MFWITVFVKTEIHYYIFKISWLFLNNLGSG